MDEMRAKKEKKAKDAEIKEVLARATAFTKKQADAPKTLQTTEQNAHIASKTRYNFGDSYHVRFLYFVTVCFTLLIMSCVVTFIAWIINKINKIIDLRDEEIHRLREEMKNRDQRGYNRSIES